MKILKYHNLYVYDLDCNIQLLFTTAKRWAQKFNQKEAKMYKNRLLKVHNIELEIEDAD